MVDPPARRGGDRGLGAKGDAEPGGLQHRQIVGAVADRECLPKRQPEFGGERRQRVALGRGGDDRRGYGARQPAVRHIEPVGDHPVKAEPCRDRFGEDREPARDQGGFHPGAAQGRDQRPRAGHRPDAGGGLAQHAFGQPAQQCHPLGERADEIDLAIHRPPCYLGDMRAQPEKIGQLLEHLVLDDRRFEIGDEQALAAPFSRLHHDIDGLSGDRRARRRLGDAGDVAGDAARQPVDAAAQRGDAAARSSASRRPAPRSE